MFLPPTRERIELEVARRLEDEPSFVSAATAASTRAAGDAAAAILAGHFRAVLGALATDFEDTFSRRAMADFAFTDVDGYSHVVDVKTHRLGTTFNMPNLTSVERLTRFYETDTNYFTLVLVAYEADAGILRVPSVRFLPIEFLSWSCLAIGALGWGQIQLANANRVVIDERTSRPEWMLEMCARLETFYAREREKVAQRLEYFHAARRRWEARATRPASLRARGLPAADDVG